MPRLTRNSRETAASNDTGSASSAGRETTPTTSSSSHVSAVPSSSVESVNAGNVVNNVVQALQGTLGGLVQSAMDACLPVLPTNSVENNLCQSYVARTANLAGNAVPVESHLETQTNRFLNVSSGYAGMVSGASSSHARGRLVPSFVNTFATRKEITDIVSWVEAFSIYSLIVCMSSPHRWRDLQAINFVHISPVSRLRVIGIR